MLSRPLHDDGFDGALCGGVSTAILVLPAGIVPLLANLKPKCDRKPREVVFTLFEGDQQRDELTLDFPHDFKMTDPTAYSPQSEVVLKAR